MFSADEVADLHTHRQAHVSYIFEENMVQRCDLYILVKSQVPFALTVLSSAATEIIGFALLTCRKFHFGLLSQINF